jgi:hypothetical protein
MLAGVSRPTVGCSSGPTTRRAAPLVRRGPHPCPGPVRGVRWPAGPAEGGGEMKLDLQTVALVAIAVALWVAVFQGFNAF